MGLGFVERSRIVRSCCWILQENLGSRLLTQELASHQLRAFLLILALRSSFQILRNLINFWQFLRLLMQPQVLIEVWICILAASTWSFTCFISSRRAIHRSNIRWLDVISHAFRRLLIDRGSSMATVGCLRLESQFYWLLFVKLYQLLLLHLLIISCFLSDNFRLICWSFLLFMWKWPSSTKDTRWISWKPLEALIHRFCHE